MTDVAESLSDIDLVTGVFAGRPGFAPVGLLAGFSKLVTVAGTGYQFRRSDIGAIIKTTNGSPVSLTLQPFAVVPLWRPLAQIAIWAFGAGQVTFIEGTADVHIRSAETLKSAKQYSSMTLTATDTLDEWFLAGYLEAA